MLYVYIWGLIFVFLGTVCGKWMISENLQRHAMVYAICGAGINILLNFQLIPLYGIQGAAMATVFSLFVVAVPINLLSGKTRKIFFMQLSSLNCIRVFRHMLR